MAQQLRTLVPLPDSMDSIPNIHMATPSSLWFQGLSGYCATVIFSSKRPKSNIRLFFLFCFWLYKMLRCSRISYHFEVFPDLLTGYLTSCKMFNCSGSASSSVEQSLQDLLPAFVAEPGRRWWCEVMELGTPFTTGAFPLVWELRLPSWLLL